MIASRKTILGTAAMFGVGAAIGRVLESVRRPAAPARAVAPVSVPVVHHPTVQQPDVRPRTTKLTYAQANEIRSRYQEGSISHRKLAKEYGVSRSTIERICNNKQYTRPGQGPVRPAPKRRLDDAAIVDIRNRYATGRYSQLELGRMYGVTGEHINQIVLGNSRRDAGGPIAVKGGRKAQHAPVIQESDLTPEIVREIREAYASGGIRQEDIARRFGIKRSMVGRVCRGEMMRDAGGPIVTKNDERSLLLTNAEVVRIREMYAGGGITHKEIARRYKISDTMVGEIVTGYRMTNVGGPITQARRSVRSSHRPLTDEQVLDIRTSPESDQEIASRLGIKLYTVQRIRAGLTYKDVA